jgi:hypothetical protein
MCLSGASTTHDLRRMWSKRESPYNVVSVVGVCLFSLGVWGCCVLLPCDTLGVARCLSLCQTR